MVLKLETSDNIIVEVEECVAVKSNLLRNLIDTVGVCGPIPLLVDYITLKKVHSFMIEDNHVLPKDYNPLEIFFSNENLLFFEGMSSEEILNLCNAANYLEYPFLLELCCKRIANELADNSKSELAKIVKGEKKLDEATACEMRKEFEWLDDLI
ncbi:S-phase kinase-associated protein 1 [Pancytospora epiphaga]|nr:S-phase kinase-associated protein 1 [Pancytospora epiphaga]